MNLADMDALELPRSLRSRDTDEEDRLGIASSAPAQPAARRWWFTFDGWRTAGVDTEFVLA